ncbi:TPA: DNA double-strand break repair nuclease NurA [Candidatus Woesearchaeota archaeon]|nr:hypothetical protein QT06_C0001G0652 [archaeon GW2011_AR15]MBS3103561.1 DNA double-strand break repair nuclease NurA [Candidatus Woesearchaeota archaeon]HIH41335.1 DNA double-strand break repair nuclease NurA [Candidatus Woesearchaeota archaeon]
MREIIEKLLEKIGKDSSGSVVFDDSAKNPVEIKKENFHDISGKKTGKKVAFVDGGNLELLKSPSLSLFFNRIYYTIYQNNKRTKSGKFEFYTLISTENKSGKLCFSTDYFFTTGKIDIKKYEFDSFDKKLALGGRRASISLVGNVIRRFAELIVAGTIKADFVVVDGSLEAAYPHEEELLKKEFYGLSKTTGLLTDNGGSAAAALSGLTGKKTWYYDAGDVCFVKLHPKSKYIFRLDAGNSVDELLPILQENSKDPVFPGYPYGLVEADKFARVSNREKEMLKMQLEAAAKKDFEKLVPYIKSMDAHDVLDSVG